MISWWAGSTGPDVGAEVDGSVAVVELGELVDVDFRLVVVVERSVVVVPPMVWSSLPHEEPRQSKMAIAMAAATSGYRSRAAGWGSLVERTGGILGWEVPCPTTAEHPAGSLLIAEAVVGNRSAYSRNGRPAS
jgi:hypothetical protein